MGALRAALFLVLLLSPWTAFAQASDWHVYVTDAATRFAIPEAWIERVIRVESRGRTTLAGRPIVSREGAMGLMQLMPATWAAMRDACGLGRDPFDPHDNIVAGAAYLRLLYDRFGYPGLFAAYNAGPGRYALYLSGQRRLPGETVRYLAAVAAPGSMTMLTPTSMFAVVAPGLSSAPTPPPPATLFAIAPRQ